MAPMEERRGDRRTRTLKSGRIMISAKAPKIDCTIRDLSATGARLLIPSSTFGIPREFELLIGDADRRSCRVAWRTESAIGVEFK
jgi:hypothetical protein